MKLPKARLLRVACIFGICGFLFGVIVAAGVIQLWASALGRYFDTPSSTETLWAHFRFGSAFAVLTASARLTGALFPQATLTRRPTWLCLAFSVVLCLISVFFVRSMCAQRAWNETYTSFYLPPTVSISQLPLFFYPFVSTALAFAGAAAFRLASAYRIVHQLFPGGQPPPRYDY